MMHCEEEISEIFDYYKYGDYNFLLSYSPIFNPIEEAIGNVQKHRHLQTVVFNKVAHGAEHAHTSMET